VSEPTQLNLIGGNVTRMRVRACLLLAFVTVASMVTTMGANAYTEGRTEGIRIFSLRDTSLGFTVRGDQVVLDRLGSSDAGRWDITPVGSPSFNALTVYKNVATGTCVAAQSPLDGVGLKLVACDPADPRQQWDVWFDYLRNEATDRCVKPEAVAVGARLYQEVCPGFNDWDSQFSDLFRVKLSVVSGNGQQIRSGQTGQPLAVKITDEDGRPQAGFTLEFELHGAWAGEDYLPSPASFGGQVVRVDAVSDAQGIARTPAVTGIRNAKGTFSATVTPRLKFYSDLFVLQKAEFQGTVL
jgi:hypothetical protein